MRASWLHHTLLPLGVIAVTVLVPALGAGQLPAHAEDQAADLLEPAGEALAADLPLDQVALAADLPLDQVALAATATPTRPPQASAGAAALLDPVLMDEIARGAPTASPVDTAALLDVIRRARQVSADTLPTREPPPPTPPRAPTRAPSPTLPSLLTAPQPPLGQPPAQPPAQSPTPTRTATPATATPAAR